MESPKGYLKVSVDAKPARNTIIKYLGPVIASVSMLLSGCSKEEQTAQKPKGKELSTSPECEKQFKDVPDEDMRKNQINDCVILEELRNLREDLNKSTDILNKSTDKLKKSVIKSTKDLDETLKSSDK